MRRFRAIVWFAAAVLWLLNSTGAQTVLVSSDFNDSVQQYDLNGNYLGAFVPIGGGGLDSPQGVTVGPDGNVYVSSANNDRVLRYNGATGAFMGAFVNGGMLDQPWYLKFGPDGNLYVSSSLTSQVLCYDGVTGAFLRVAAAGGGLTRPDGIGFDSIGNLLVSDFAPSSDIKKYNPQTGQFLANVVVDAGLVQPLEHRFSPDGTLLYVSSFTTSEIKAYEVATGLWLGDLASSPPLDGPVGQLVLPDGTLLVSSWNDSSIYRLNAETGALLQTFGSGGALNHPNNMTLLVVPEPCTTGMYLLLGVMGCRAARQRARIVRRDTSG